MTDYTDLCAQGEAARWNLLYSSRDPETGDDLFPGTFVHLSVEDANGAAVTITALIAAIRDLEAQKRELALDVLAASGQAQEAYQAQLAAEAERDELRAAIFGSRDYDPVLRNGNFREMAETLHAARAGAVGRAEAAEATVAAQAAQIEAMQKKIDDLTILDRAGDISIAALNKQVEKLRGALELIADTDPDEGTAWFHTVANAALTTEEGNG